MPALPFVAEHSRPQRGDVVVVPEPEPPVTWSVRRYQGPPQIAARSRRDAIGLASSVAKDLVVDLWSFENHSYHIVERHRPERVTAWGATGGRRA
jgi:hypothetical protein